MSSITISLALTLALTSLTGPGNRDQADPPPAPPGRIRIVLLGDSITKGVRAGVRLDETFGALVERDLRHEGVDVEVINLGIGGERTDQALQRLEQVDRQRPAIVAIMYGTNDSYVDRGSDQSRVTPERYRAGLIEMVDRFRSRGIRPILMTEPRWADDAPLNGLDESPNDRLAVYVAQCREVARDRKVPLVDHFEHWTNARSRGQNLTEWTTDGCHPNAAGHRELARGLLRVLRSEIEGGKPKKPSASPIRTP
ncbi:MAG: GDSL-type esterase/lipase family protein [Isosphaeraceae bacterium]